MFEIPKEWIYTAFVGLCGVIGYLFHLMFTPIKERGKRLEARVDDLSVKLEQRDEEIKELTGDFRELKGEHKGVTEMATSALEVVREAIERTGKDTE